MKPLIKRQAIFFLLVIICTPLITPVASANADRWITISNESNVSLAVRCKSEWTKGCGRATKYEDAGTYWISIAAGRTDWRNGRLINTDCTNKCWSSIWFEFYYRGVHWATAHLHGKDDSPMIFGPFEMDYLADLNGIKFDIESFIKDDDGDGHGTGMGELFKLTISGTTQNSDWRPRPQDGQMRSYAEPGNCLQSIDGASEGSGAHLWVHCASSDHQKRRDMTYGGRGGDKSIRPERIADMCLRENGPNKKVTWHSCGDNPGPGLQWKWRTGTDQYSSVVYSNYCLAKESQGNNIVLKVCDSNSQYQRWFFATGQGARDLF